ncbi:MAG: hypothetical protein CMP61_01335 [Flavobacteriales bacterium]|nr:hypothetical protein [Flavobacteriales bacterium]|tara:strand:- start:83888 stop:84715 length:828 start_codon:yes stop_codon:yes gene_type:complete
MARKNPIHLFAIAILWCSVSFAQYNSDFGSSNQCYKKTFSVVAWVLTDTMDLALPITQEIVEDALSEVSEDFSDICVDFKLCQYTELPNHRQDILVRGIHDEEIAALYRKKNVINLYIATSVVDRSPEPGYCGYAIRGDSSALPDTNLRDALFLAKGCFSARTLSHVLGSYFGLFPTYETIANGIELVDGSNCATAGDLICDTPADEPSGSNGNIENCQIVMNQQSQQTETGLTYEVPICNLMSKYPESGCEMRFTREQFNRMLYIMKTGRKYLW